MKGRDEFGEGRDSIARRLRTEGTAAERRAAAERRRKYYADQEAVEKWAGDGFSSGGSVREPGELADIEDLDDEV